MRGPAGARQCLRARKNARAHTSRWPTSSSQSFCKTKRTVPVALRWPLLFPLPHAGANRHDALRGRPPLRPYARSSLPLLWRVALPTEQGLFGGRCCCYDSQPRSERCCSPPPSNGEYFPFATFHRDSYDFSSTWSRPAVITLKRMPPTQ